MAHLVETLRRRRLWIAALAAALAAYAGLGFLVAPGILRRQLERRLGEALRREVRVERVRLNPFALSVTVLGFSARDRDGAVLVAFDRLYVNADVAGLLRREIGLSEVELEQPFLRVAIDARGRLNFADLLEPAAPTAPAPGEPAGDGGLGLGVERLRIAGARVEFADRALRRPFDTTFGPVTLELRSIHTGRRGHQSPYSFSGQTESGERFAWSGEVLLDPVRSRGTFGLEEVLLPKYAPYLEGATPVDLRGGVLGLEASYEVDLGAERRVLRVSGGKLSLRRLELAARGAPDPAVALPEIDVAGIAIDGVARSAEVERVALRGGRLRVRREAGGRIELVDMLAPPPEAPAPPPGPGPAAGPPGPRFRLGELGVDGLRIDLDDRAAPRPVEARVELQRLRLNGLSLDPAAPVALSLAALVDGEGKVAAEGTVFPLWPRGGVRLTVEALDLSPFGPYLESALDARLEEAVLAASLRASFDAGEPAVRWAVGGEVRLDGLRMVDGRRGEEFLRWRSLRLEGIDAEPGRAALGAVRLLDPRLRAIVWEDGRRNLSVVARQPEPAASPAGGAGRAAPARGGAPAQRWSIGTLQVARGRASFTDRSVSPAAVLELADLEVRVGGLASEPRSRARVEVGARVGGAPLAVRGALQPLLAGDATDLAVESRGIDLTPLGPYVGKYAGYRLQKGKLDLDLRCTVRQRTVEAQNVARIDQLTLGEPTGSPDATSLPVKLGLAVLTDPDGVILLDVPVSGSVDDPSFRLGRVIWMAIVNLFTKAALSPFAALGGLFGSGQPDLDRIDFEPGEAAIGPAAAEKLAVLAKALRARPALRLEVEGFADEAVDGPALARQQVRERVRRAKWSAQRERDAGLALDAVQVGAEEYPRWLAAAFRALPAPPGAAPAPAAALPPPEEMERRLAASAPVGPEAYRELAARRAAAARERLLAGDGLDPARVFVVEGGARAAQERGARAYFGLGG